MRMNFDFDAWWKEMKPAECDEFKPYFEESWQLGFKDGYEKGVAAFHEAVKIEREKYAYRDGHHAGWLALAGENAVLLGLLTDCAAIIKTIAGEDSDEAEKLNDLLSAIDRALDPSRHKGALL